MCVNQTSKIFISTQPCFVYKVVSNKVLSKLRYIYHSCVSTDARMPQKLNYKLYTCKEWEEMGDYPWYEQGTKQQYIINEEKTSSFPGFYCFNTEKDTRNYIKEFRYISNPCILMCLVPEGTNMFNGEVKIWPENDPIPSINVFKLTPIRELVA
jgi:hypothetical protein